MKVALVHDYIKEFGGAERVLKTFTQMYPKAPIYTSFTVKGSAAEKEFRGKDIRESWLAPILKIGNLYSPLRFLAPFIWGSYDLSRYDLVITSCSWYITRGFKVSPKTKVIAYCHTPPRWLYGYDTSVGFTNYWPVKIYSAIVGHFMRLYDWKTAQKINYWIANSKNVQQRIKKFYRKDSVVIYPPVEVEKIRKEVRNDKKTLPPYFLVVSRLVGAKGLEAAVEAFKNLPYKLLIAGEAYGYSDVERKLKNLSGNNVEFLGRLDDPSLYHTYSQAKGFIALARDEDFGITTVEAMAAGTPVIAFNGGGFRESVIDGVTGILVNDTDTITLKNAITRLDKTKWEKVKLQTQARKFNKENFIKKIKQMVENTG